MIKVIIIDDEQNAVQSLRTILSEYCDDIEICGTAGSALDGIKIINQLRPDLVFLDVEMPHGTGFDMLDAIQERFFKVVFTTAYNHYAIKAIKYSALDYLLKPLDIDEVIAVVKKIQTASEPPEITQKKYDNFLNNIKEPEKKRVLLPTNEGIIFFFLSDIIRVEADGSYSKIYLSEKKILYISKNIKEIESLFSDERFFRTHNSYLINLDCISKYLNKDGGCIEMNDKAEIPLSRRKKIEFFEKFKLNHKD